MLKKKTEKRSVAIHSVRRKEQYRILRTRDGTFWQYDVKNVDFLISFGPIKIHYITFISHSCSTPASNASRCTCQHYLFSSFGASDRIIYFKSPVIYVEFGYS